MGNFDLSYKNELNTCQTLVTKCRSKKLLNIRYHGIYFVKFVPLSCVLPLNVPLTLFPSFLSIFTHFCPLWLIILWPHCWNWHTSADTHTFLWRESRTQTAFLSKCYALSVHYIFFVIKLIFFTCWTAIECVYCSACPIDISSLDRNITTANWVCAER